MRLTGLATVARRTGYPVKEVSGWRSRGSSAYNRPKSVIVHHTASGSRSGNAASLNVVTYGRPGLSGPLCQLLLARDGTIYVVASGRANHAGRVSASKYSNSNSIGIEAENNGVGEAWSERQMDAYAKLCRELCDHYGISISNVRGHREVAVPRGRKIDPTFNMGSFRSMVKKRKGTGAKGGSGGNVGSYESAKSKHKVGSRVMGLHDGGTDVIWLQEELKKLNRYTGGKVDGLFGPALESAVRGYQKSRGLSVDGLAGKDTIDALKSGAKKVVSKPKPKPKPSSSAPKFPLKSGWYFGPKSGPTRSVSGHYGHRAALRKWQAKMRNRGWTISVDGLYGPQTRKVARQLQAEKKLGVDGLVGKRTWDAAWEAPVT